MNDDDLKKIGEIVYQKITKALEVSEKRIMGEIGDFINKNILPQLDRMEDSTNSISRKLDITVAKDVEQDRRLDKIEAVPVIAHEIKRKK